MQSPSSMPDSTPENAGITRRNVVQGIAWSLPVIAAATAVPLAAASNEFTATLTSLQVAPSVAKADGPQGMRANLRPDMAFNTIGFIRNDGPAAASDLRAQVTFSADAIPDAFTATAPWVVSNVGFNAGLNRWLVSLTYAGTVQPGDSVRFVVQATTKIAPQFPMGQSGGHVVLGRAYDSTGAITNDITDYFYVQRNA